MKKFKENVCKAVAGTVLSSVKKEVDSACMFIGYQPKMPAKVNKLISRK